MQRETRDVKLDKLLPFKDSLGQAYEDGWAQQLADFIGRTGLLQPVIARPVDGGKYEILCGYNRVKALELLGCESIHAEIRDGLSDDEAAALYNDSHLNKELFSACDYSQKFEIIKCCEKFIKANSHQGKRTDLEERTAIKTVIGTEDTCVQLVPSVIGEDEELVPNLHLNESHKSRRPTIRNKVADCLGISKATLDKYMRIIKLPDELLQSIACLLDEKRITFEMAYILANTRELETRLFIEFRDRYPDRKIDCERLKKLPHKGDIEAPKSRKRVYEVLLPEGNDMILVKRK